MKQYTHAAWYTGALAACALAVTMPNPARATPSLSDVLTFTRIDGVMRHSNLTEAQENRGRFARLAFAPIVKYLHPRIRY